MVYSLYYREGSETVNGKRSLSTAKQSICLLAFSTLNFLIRLLAQPLVNLVSELRNLSNRIYSAITLEYCVLSALLGCCILTSASDTTFCPPASDTDIHSASIKVWLPQDYAFPFLFSF